MQGPLRTSSAVVAIVVLLGHSAVSHGAPSKRACYQTCTEAKRDCAGEVRAALVAEQSSCRGTNARVRRCKRDAKSARKSEVATCGTVNAACRACCRDGGDACGTGPTTTAPSSSSSTTAVPTTSSTAPVTTTTASATTTTVPASTTTSTATTSTSSSSSTVTPTTSSTTTTIAAACGNGAIDAGEACDPNASPNGCFVDTPFCIDGCAGCSSLCSELVLTLGPATADCGFPGVGDPAVPPLSGKLLDVSKAVTPAGDLGLGCLYFGGGLASIIPPGPFPDGSTTVFHVSDCSGDLLALEPAATGNPATCTLGPETTKHCVNGHPGFDEAGACTKDSDCQPVCVGGHCIDGAPGTDGAGACTGSANCGPSSITGAAEHVCQPDPSCFFGNPVPIVNGGVSLCLVNVVEDGLTGAASKVFGTASVSVPLKSYLYLTGLEADYNPYFGGSPCPRCDGGACSAGTRKGLACSTTSVLGVTSDCPPSGHLFLSAIDIDLALSTSRAKAFSDTQGIFCAGQTYVGAFGQPTVREIIEDGAPAAGGLDDDAHSAVLATVFCIPLTGNGLIDSAANLPGPGAVAVDGSLRLR